VLSTENQRRSWRTWYYVQQRKYCSPWILGLGYCRTSDSTCSYLPDKTPTGCHHPHLVYSCCPLLVTVRSQWVLRYINTDREHVVYVGIFVLIISKQGMSHAMVSDSDSSSCLLVPLGVFIFILSPHPWKHLSLQPLDGLLANAEESKCLLVLALTADFHIHSSASRESENHSLASHHHHLLHTVCSHYQNHYSLSQILNVQMTRGAALFHVNGWSNSIFRIFP